ncbi:hypothetical protein R3P38DRAFT_3171590 [Favolaschia claudopus]|uniref:Uncharacterized protein n=1 Tax=Favolaschia claudopus TaxID=2862362 RepID=A0AAW0DNQ2_9AGAR
MAFRWESFPFSAELGSQWMAPRFVEGRVRSQLERAGLQPDIALRILRKTESVISGSTTLPVLINLSFTPNDLDMYTPLRYEGIVLVELSTKLAFTVFRRTEEHYKVDSSIVRVHWLRKGHHIINLLVVAGENAPAAIFRFHSTIVMNFISGYGVFCGYPELTLRKKSIANHSVLQDKISRSRALVCFEKYESRGVLTHDDLRGHDGWVSHVCGTDKSCPSTLRSLHDDGSLFVSFQSTSTPECPPIMHSGFASVLWSLGGTRCAPLPISHPLVVQTLPLLFIEETEFDTKGPPGEDVHAEMVASRVRLFTL